MPLVIHDDGIKIEIDGKSEVFGGLDLEVKAVKALIGSLDFKFAQEDDFEIDQKTYLVLLDAIGARLKLDMPAFDDDKASNIETIHQFLSWVIQQEVHKQPEYAELLDQECDC